MALILGILQFLLITYICVYEFRLRSAAVFLWATLLIMFGVMHLLTSFTGDAQFSDATLVNASLFVLLFCFMYLGARLILAGSFLKSYSVKLQYDKLVSDLKTQKHMHFLFAAFVLVLVAKLFPYVRYAGNILSTSWGAGRNYSASLNYVNSESLVNIGFYVLSGLFDIFWLKGKKKDAVLIGLLLIANIIISRNRIEILPLVCSIIFIWLMKNKGLKIRTVLWAVTAAVAVIYIIYGLRVFRFYGTIGNFIQQFRASEFFETLNNLITTGNGELGLRRNFYYFISQNNHFKDFGKGHSYIRMLLVYIPTRFSFGIKPDDFAIAMGSAVGMSVGGSTHPTLFGDCYANLGMFGIFLGIFWALYATVADAIVLSGKDTGIRILKYILLSVSYVIIGRGSVYNGFWFSAYGIPALMVMGFCWEKVRIIWGGKKQKGIDQLLWEKNQQEEGW